MGEQLSEADRALIERSISFGHTFTPGVHSLSSVDLAKIIQAARTEGPHPGKKQVEIPHHFIGDEEGGPAVAVCYDLPGGHQVWSGEASQQAFDALDAETRAAFGSNSGEPFVVHAGDHGVHILARACDTERAMDLAAAYAYWLAAVQNIEVGIPATVHRPGESGEWVMVPREPTPEIEAAMRDAFSERTSWGARAAYRAALQSASPPPKGAGADPVAWTNKESLQKIKRGWHGNIVGERSQYKPLPLYAAPALPVEGVSLDRVARAIADGFSNGDEQYDAASEPQRARYDMAARSVAALTARKLGGV